jgi:hypothetical protein
MEATSESAKPGSEKPGSGGPGSGGPAMPSIERESMGERESIGEWESIGDRGPAGEAAKGLEARASAVLVFKKYDLVVLEAGASWRRLFPDMEGRVLVAAFTSVNGGLTATKLIREAGLAAGAAS